MCVPVLVHWFLSGPPHELQQSTDNESKKSSLVNNCIESTSNTDNAYTHTTSSKTNFNT